MAGYEFDQPTVTVGGGTGHEAALEGLRIYLPPRRISALVSMVDSGGSSGWWRNERGALPPGDIGKCMVGLSDPNDLEERQALFSFRFPNYDNHTIINFILMAQYQLCHDMNMAIDRTRRLFHIKSQIIPVTLFDTHLGAETKHDSHLLGEANIDTRATKPDYHPDDKILGIYLSRTAHLNPRARGVIRRAENVVFTPGDLYTSILPNLLVKGTADRIAESKAKVYFVLNLMTKAGETDGYSAVDFVKAFVHYYGHPGRLDYVIANINNVPAQEDMDTYQKKGQEYITLTKEHEDEIRAIAPNVQVVRAPLARFHRESNLFRHNSDRLARVILDTENVLANPHYFLEPPTRVA